MKEQYWLGIIGLLTIILKGKSFWKIIEKFLFHKKDVSVEQENKVTVYLEERVKALEVELKEEREQKELLLGRVIKRATKSHGKKDG